MNDAFTPKAPALTPDEVLIKWQQARDEMIQAQTNEFYYRNLAIGTFFPNINQITAEGVENFELGNGYKLKCTFKLNYKLDKTDKVDTMLDTLSETGEDGKFVAERVVKWSPNLSLSEYRQLSPEHKKLIDSVLTVKPATPSHEIVEPKK